MLPAGRRLALSAPSSRFAPVVNHGIATAFPRRVSLTFLKRVRRQLY
jgi:hypothetical protein